MSDSNTLLAGLPFTIELDVESYNPDTEAWETVTLDGATGVNVRLTAPDGTDTDYGASLAGSPDYRITYTGTGSEFTAAGTWEARAIYNLSGTDRESFKRTFEVIAAS